MKFKVPIEYERASERTQASIVTDFIRRDIIAGIFPPGSKLLLRALSERYDVGMIPMREALSRLAIAGFVTLIDQRGFRVARASKEELLDIMHVMTNIEAQALEDAIEHGDLAWEGKVVSAYHQVSKLPMVNEKIPGTMNPQWEIAHDAFHTALLSACTSPWLLRLAAILRGQSARYRFLSVNAMEAGVRDIAGEHALILAATLKRDARAASNALVEHLQTTARLAIGQSMLKPTSKNGKRRAPPAATV
ncbi:MAG: FCD domain-containing protein [Glaciimonas sp.]|nr:FCD domain-containing protein [Glaciimonas sp.]